MLIPVLDNGSEKVQQRARHKADPIIAAGLNQACSEVDPVSFKKASPHTNACEQTHQKSYMWGKRLPLLQAVLKWVVTGV